MSESEAGVDVWGMYGAVHLVPPCFVLNFDSIK